MIDTFCKETVLYFPTNLRGNYSPEEAWGKLAKAGRDYSRKKPGGSPQRVATTTPGRMSWGSPQRVAATDPGESLAKKLW